MAAAAAVLIFISAMMAAALRTATIVSVVVSFASEAVIVTETIEIAASSHGCVVGIAVLEGDRSRTGRRKKRKGRRKSLELAAQATGPLIPHQDTRINTTPPIGTEPNISAQDVHPFHHHHWTLLGCNNLVD
ncbi:PREDICTED: uncharacterized protein LOC105128412 isoform X2 [Populus euphratica]|uniref:Uncharacterized protein LOC105128412 isoform X2 n=1 Tax=Populus euphratica TaxID=75702 RepID=A0AAJ6UFF1_POPEU|nr:PREDICTED: uncharacterized protein LOC105128412 isoform X2 [Populus euphratica]